MAEHVEEDQRITNEFMADLNAEYHERALLANQKRFYKRFGRVGLARKPINKSKETCFTCGKLVSPTHAIKKKTKTKSSTVPALISEKKGEASTENLLLTLMEEVTSLKEHIKVPSDNSPSVSQTGSSKSSKGKQTTWFGPCKHCVFKNHLAKDCYLKPKCSTCGSTNHLTKEHPEQTAVKRTMTMFKAQSSVNPLAKKAYMILKPFKDCKYCGFIDHHYDNYEYYSRCEICGSIAHEPADCPKKQLNSRKLRIANK
ncbi:hypothetical protein Tco_0980019 [Tanacetum coccineum]